MEWSRDWITLQKHPTWHSWTLTTRPPICPYYGHGGFRFVFRTSCYLAPHWDGPDMSFIVIVTVHQNPTAHSHPKLIFPNSCNSTSTDSLHVASENAVRKPLQTLYDMPFSKLPQCRPVTRSSNDWLKKTLWLINHVTRQRYLI